MRKILVMKAVRIVLLNHRKAKAACLRNNLVNSLWKSQFQLQKVLIKKNHKLRFHYHHCNLILYLKIIAKFKIINLKFSMRRLKMT